MNIWRRGTQSWRALDPAWKFALGAFLVARGALSAWALLLAGLFPVLVQNLDLFGAPTLAVFDVATGARYAYAREVDGVRLTFRAGEPGIVLDDQTGSAWSLREARAVSGKFAGRTLPASFYPVEDIFPYRGIVPETNVLASVWQRFDTNWYLKIAQRGYGDDAASAVYFPLYPLLVHLAGGSLFAALAISNLALIGALALLYQFAARWFDAASARRAVAYWLLFPTGFFLLAAYTESLFLFLALAAFECARRDKWMGAAVCGALAALTRLQGVLLVVPLAYLCLQQLRNTQHAIGTTHYVLRITYYVLRSASLLLLPLATAAFLAFTNLALVSSYVGELHARFVLPWENFAAAIGLLASGRASFVDGLNLAVAVLFGGLLIAIWKKLPLEYVLFAGAMYLAPLFRMTTTQPLVSMDRYALAILPAFILLGKWGKNSWINRAVVYLGFPLQLYLSAQFVLWGWVG